MTWTIIDTRGYLDGGPSCSECGTCDCPTCQETAQYNGTPDSGCILKVCHTNDGDECVGLSFAYGNLDDDSEILCESCATKAGIIIMARSSD